MPKTQIPPPRVDDAGELMLSVPRLQEPRYSQSVERGLAILGCLTPRSPLLGIAELADMLGMSRSTTHRYAITLVALGYLEQGKGRKYRLALSVTDLGMSAMNTMSLSTHSEPLLRELSQRLGYTTSLAVLDGPEIVYLDRVLGSARRGRVDRGPTIGSRLPLHCTAMGKLLLAYLYDAARQELMDELTLSKFGPNTITSKRRLRAELETIRETGFAINDEELTPNLIAIAVPVRCDSGEAVAAANLVAQKTVISIEQLASTLAPHLIATADRLSARLGYRRPDEPVSPVSRLYNIGM